MEEKKLLMDDSFTLDDFFTLLSTLFRETSNLIEGFLEDEDIVGAQRTMRNMFITFSLLRQRLTKDSSIGMLREFLEEYALQQKELVTTLQAYKEWQQGGNNEQ